MTTASETTWYDFAKTILEEAARASREVSWFVEASRGRPLITKRIIPITLLLPHARPTPFSRIPDSFEPSALSRQTGERSCNELFPRGMGSIDQRVLT